ncbi:molybdate ABC transporter substrate-binding protein [Alkalicoccobacillus gibsonii]|uniref:Molybdate ABC transporter substrate-binding protein n=1 Tax=Alkalicoccobacillus gibsonii TaxID=79881 RepID=A0ABU9VEU5_9BACI
MKKRMGALVLTMMLAGCGSNTNSSQPEDIHVMAAASLTDALEEMKPGYEEEHNVKLVINYGSSGKLREQITQGAPADLFLSASSSDMDQLIEKNEVEKSSNLLMNRLVLIATPEVADELQEVNDLTNDQLQKISIGQPESVPAGRYSKQALESLGLWDELEDRLIYGSDVRQVLTYVETGNADAGLVYETDAKTSSSIKLIEIIPEDTHDPIQYPFGLLKEAASQDTAVEFYEYLQTEEALNVFESYGFSRGE